MLILINMSIPVIGLDSMHVHNFHYQTVARVKLSLFLDLINSSSIHVDNKKKDILVLGEGSTQRIDDSTIKSEVKYPIRFTESAKIFVLPLHYNGSNNFLFVNAAKIYQLKAKYSKTKTIYILCLDNISKYFAIHNMRKTGLKGVLKVFFVHYNAIATNRYLMKET